MAKQDYKFTGILYPDATNYDCQSVLEALSTVFDSWSYILHDMDVDGNGELKKPHYHWVGHRRTAEGKDSPCSVDTVANALGIPANDVEYCKSEKAAIRYLIHADDPEKYQYDRGLIQANISLEKYFRDKSGDYDSRRILDYIYGSRPSTVTEAAGWAIRSGVWAEFRRGFAVWAQVIREVQNLG